MPSELVSQKLSGLEKWVASIGCESRLAKCTTIGLVGGSRQGTDRRVTDVLAKNLSNGLRASCPDARLLVVRLDIEQPHRAFGRLARLEEQQPTIISSPLGRWYFVEVPVPAAKTAPWAIKQIPKWLPEWKQDYSVILFDLGAIHLAPSRTVGRLCDGCYVLLGPDTCASSDWILQHVAWHERAGAQIIGTLVSTFERAA